MSEYENAVFSSGEQHTSLQRGDKVKFGKWPYSDKSDIRPVEWVVLKIYKEDNKEDETALLITKDCIDCQPCDKIDKEYTIRMTWMENELVPYSFCWHRSYLLSWLKNEFYARCFSAEEKRQIINQEIKKGKKKYYIPVNLLSAVQALSLMPRPHYRQAIATPYSVKSEEDHQPIAWWLQDNAGFHTDAAAVFPDGSVCVRSSEEHIWTDFYEEQQKKGRNPDCHGITVTAMIGVRPTILVKLPFQEMDK